MTTKCSTVNTQFHCVFTVEQDAYHIQWPLKYMMYKTCLCSAFNNVPSSGIIFYDSHLHYQAVCVWVEEATVWLSTVDTKVLYKTHENLSINCAAPPYCHHTVIGVHLPPLYICVSRLDVWASGCRPKPDWCWCNKVKTISETFTLFGVWSC